MKTLLAGLLVACFALSASARIGETPEECKARYGEPMKNGENWDFVKNGYRITLHFYAKRVYFIEFNRIGGKNASVGWGGELSENEIESLLASNVGKGEWKKMETQRLTTDREWFCEESLRHAQYSAIHHVLSSSTLEWIAREDEEKKRKEDKNLDGL